MQGRAEDAEDLRPDADGSWPKEGITPGASGEPSKERRKRAHHDSEKLAWHKRLSNPETRKD